MADMLNMNLLVKDPTYLTSIWNFIPSPASATIRLEQLIYPFIYARPRPRHAVVKPMTPNDYWIVYFIYLPDGHLLDHHLFTLTRLRELGINIYVVCASEDVRTVPEPLLQYSDALCWKSLSGYDFSAYTIALETICEFSPHATALIMNDSMFGPFTDLRPFIQKAPWDLTGFTGSHCDENHLQSYAFILKDINFKRLAQMRSIFYSSFAYNYGNPVVKCQELRMARVAKKHMSVGAFWYSEAKAIDDPCLRLPFALMKAGFPFMKRSLLGKMQEFQNRDEVLAHLASNNHPLNHAEPGKPTA